MKHYLSDDVVAAHKSTKNTSYSAEEKNRNKIKNRWKERIEIEMQTNDSER